MEAHAGALFIRAFVADSWMAGFRDSLAYDKISGQFQKKSSFYGGCDHFEQ
jgi:hypothetical protein